MNRCLSLALLLIGQQLVAIEPFFSVGESAYHFSLEGESVFYTSRKNNYGERTNFDNMVVRHDEFVHDLLRHNNAKTFQARSEHMSFPAVLEVGARHHLDESSSISISLNVSQPLIANIQHTLAKSSSSNDPHNYAIEKTYYAHSTSFYEPVSFDFGYTFVDEESNRFNLGLYLMDLRHVISDQVPSLSLKSIMGHAYTDRHPSFGVFVSASAPLITSFDQRFSSSMFIKLRFSEGFLFNDYPNEVKNIFMGLPGRKGRILNNESLQNSSHNFMFDSSGNAQSSWDKSLKKSGVLRYIPVQDLSLSMWMLSLGIEITPQFGLSYE